MRGIDMIMVVSYLAASALIPWWMARRQKSKEDYIMAGRKMHWFPLALAGVAAGFSAVSMLAIPGFVIARDMRYLPTLFVVIPAIPIVFYLIVPLLYKLSIVSVYEYLEMRFCPAIRTAASCLFMVSKLGYLSMAILTPAMALTSVTGWPIGIFIVLREGSLRRGDDGHANT